MKVRGVVIVVQSNLSNVEVPQDYGLHFQQSNVVEVLGALDESIPQLQDPVHVSREILIKVGDSGSSNFSGTCALY